MESLLYLLPAAGCAAMMGGMMWMMRRGHPREPDSARSASDQEIAALREELAALREGAAQQHASGG